MFATCAFCSSAFDGDGGESGLGVGKRFAYDEWRSQAWVVCPRCGRWNLTPYDNRLDTIASLSQMVSAGRVAATTEQVALMRVGAYDVVRVGQPPRVEMAGWRYGERLKARERERLKVLVPATIVAVGGAVAINVAAGGAMGYMIGQVPQMVVQGYTAIIGNRKVTIEPGVCATCGGVMVVRNRHLRDARLTHTSHADLSLLLSCPSCKSYGAQLEGVEAETAVRAGLMFANMKRSGIKKNAAGAADYLERHGGPEDFIRNTGRMEPTLKNLTGFESLALEMAVDEQAELHELERQWRQAEEIAAIADGMLVDPAIEKRLEDVRRRAMEHQGDDDGFEKGT